MYGQKEDKKSSQILYSCYFNRSREGEQFIPEHVFSYQVSGTLTINDGNKEYIVKEGDFRFSRRNHLVKFIKQPPEGGEFKSISVYLDQETLRNFSIEYGCKADKRRDDCAILQLKPDPLYKNYMESLVPYEQLKNNGNEKLLSLKLKEAILILLQANPELKDVLFDFADPGKIDLEAYMIKNSCFRLWDTLEIFSYNFY